MPQVPPQQLAIGLFSLGPVVILGWFFLCVGCPVHCEMLNSIPSLDPPDTSSTPSCDNPEMCPGTKCFLRAGHPSENHCFRELVILERTVFCSFSDSLTEQAEALVKMGREAGQCPARLIPKGTGALCCVLVLQGFLMFLSRSLDKSNHRPAFL